MGETLLVVLALDRPRREDCHKFEASLKYIARSCLKNKLEQKTKEKQNKTKNKQMYTIGETKIHRGK